MMMFGHAHNCYSLSFNSNKTLLAAAGSGGFVSVFGTSKIKSSAAAVLKNNKENNHDQQGHSDHTSDDNEAANRRGGKDNDELGKEEKEAEEAEEGEEEEEDIKPLVSASIHRRWSSGVKLLELPNGNPQEPLVLSSSDDAHIILCKLRQPQSGKVRLSVIVVFVVFICATFLS